MFIDTKDSPKTMSHRRGCWLTFLTQKEYPEGKWFAPTTSPIRLASEADWHRDDTAQKGLFVGLCVLDCSKKAEVLCHSRCVAGMWGGRCDKK